MCKFFILATALLFVAFSAHAAEANYALVSKKGAPEVTISFRLHHPDADKSDTKKAFDDIQSAFVKAGWMVVGNDWTKVPESTNQIRSAADKAVHCFVDVIGMPKTVHVRAMCGSGNQFGNGLFVHAEINPVTSKDWQQDIQKVPNIIGQLRAYYGELDAKGLTKFVSRW